MAPRSLGQWLGGALDEVADTWLGWRQRQDEQAQQENRFAWQQQQADREQANWQAVFDREVSRNRAAQEALQREQGMEDVDRTWGRMSGLGPYGYLNPQGPAKQKEPKLPGSLDELAAWTLAGGGQVSMEAIAAAKQRLAEKGRPGAIPYTPSEAEKQLLRQIGRASCRERVYHPV